MCVLLESVTVCQVETSLLTHTYTCAHPHKHTDILCLHNNLSPAFISDGARSLTLSIFHRDCPLLSFKGSEVNMKPVLSIKVICVYISKIVDLYKQIFRYVSFILQKKSKWLFYSDSLHYKPTNYANKKSFYNCFVEDKTKENNKYGKCYYHLKMWMSVCVTWSLVASLKNVHNIAPLSI